MWQVSLNIADLGLSDLPAADDHRDIACSDTLSVCRGVQYERT